MAKFPERLGTIIARRRLKHRNANKYATIFIGSPRKITRSGESYLVWGIIEPIQKGAWFCPLKISGLPKSKDIGPQIYSEAWGRDSLEALLSALSGIGAILDRYQPALCWSQSDGFNPGLPMMLETYGLKNRLELKDKFLTTIGHYLRKPEYRERSPHFLKTQAIIIRWAEKQDRIAKKSRTQR